MPISQQDKLAAALARTWEMGRSGQSAEALERTRELLDDARANQDVLGTALCLTQIGWFCLQQGYPEQGIDCIAAAKTLWAQSDDTDRQASAASISVLLFVELGLVDEGFAEANTAISLAEIKNDPLVVAFATNAKAVALMSCRQDQLAEPLLRRAVKLARSVDDRWAEAMYLANLAYSQVSLAEAAESEGNAEEGLRLRKLAIVTNDRALALAEGYGDRWNMRVTLCNGAEYYALIGQTEQALAYLARWDEVTGKVGQREQIHQLYTRGEILTLLGRLPEALEVCEAAVKLAEVSTNADSKVSTYRRLSDVYEALGQFDRALAMHKRFHVAYQGQMGEVTRRRAQLVEMQLENDKLRARAEAFEEEAGRDALTDLPNRRSFDAAFAQLQGTAFCFGILDLDHFKNINDRHSHIVGDLVLRRVAELIGSLGPAMQAFRLGGEEFALLFPGHDLAAAHVVADAVREAFEHVPWSQLSPGLAVTASIGLASATKAISQPELMAIADRRLYRAKADGRNRLVSSDGGEALGLSA